MRDIIITLMGFILPVFLAGQSIHRTGDSKAVFFVGGNFDRWSNFSYEAYDQVKDIADELGQHFGFKNVWIEDPTKAEILKALSDLSRQSFGPQDQLLLYFSSHGIYERGRKGALIPKDGKRNEGDDYETWITYDQLEKYVVAIPCHHILLAIDACYSGTFAAEYRGRPEKPVWEQENECEVKMKNALKNDSRLYLTSGGIERTPVDSDFAKKWLEALQQRTFRGTLSYHGLLDVLYEAVPTPVAGDFTDHKDGNFIFVRDDACSGAAIEELRVPFLSFYMDNTKYTYKQFAKNNHNPYWLLRNLNIEQPGSQSACYDGNELLCNEYGRLYTWAGAREACRSLGAGWRLPTEEEVKQLAWLNGGGYNALVQTLGDPRQAYENMISDEGMNFKAQLGGSRNLKDQYRRKGSDGFYWADGGNALIAPYYHLDKSKKELILFTAPKGMYFSCRCVKDPDK